MNDAMYKTCLRYVSIPSSAPRPLGTAHVPILLSEVEQEESEAIVVGAGLCDGEGERAYTEHAPTFYKRYSTNDLIRLNNNINNDNNNRIG